MKILLVDDAADIRLLVTAVLATSEHFEVVAMRSGAEGLEYLQEEPVDALLVDLMMPEMDGIEFLERCQAIASAAGLPAVLLTGSADSERVSQLRGARLAGVIAKPFNPQVLDEKLQTILGLKPATPASD
ncbi:MAG: response regulator [Acidimicrobiia bacterium]